MTLRNTMACLAAVLVSVAGQIGCSSGDGGKDDVVQGADGADGGAADGSEVQQDTPDEPECDPLFQDCVIDEGCYLKDGGKVACDIAGTGKEGDTCVFRNSCEPGLVCVNKDPGSVCAVLCSASDDTHAKACKSICKETYGTLVGTDGLGFCKAKEPIIPCDILKQDCPQDQGCYLSAEGVSCAKTTKDLDIEDTCTYANECKPGLVCVNDTCNKVCDISSPECPLHLPVCGPLPGAVGAGICVAG